MHDSATTMFMRCKMNGINGIREVYTIYTPTACVADPGAQTIALKLSPGPKRMYSTHRQIGVQLISVGRA